MKISSEKEEEVAITLEDKPPTKKKKQSSLASFFNDVTSVVKEVEKPDNVNKAVKKRTLQTETAEKWKTTSLVQYDAENLLSIQPDDNNKKLVKTMHCKLSVSTKMRFVGYHNSFITGRKMVVFVYNF